MAETYYPPISSIVALEDLPPQLDFLSDSADLRSLFNKIFFRGLQYSMNARGDEGFFSLTLIVYQRLGFDLPELVFGDPDETDNPSDHRFSLYLNPSELDYSPENPEHEFTSELPLAVNYRWGVLRFIDGFNLETFLNDVKGLYNLAVQKLEFDPGTVIAEAIAKFTDANDPTDPVEQFIDAVRVAYPALGAVTIPGTAVTLAEKIAAVVPVIEDLLDKPILEVLYKTYLDEVGSTVETLKGRVNELFGSFLGGTSILEYLEDLLIPEIDATLGVGIELEFPVDILKPVDENDEVIAGKSKIKLVGGRFHFSTKGDISYEDPTTVYFKRSEIGNTGLIISVNGARLDLSRTQNIPEIAGDGRTPDFVGVYIKKAVVSFPIAWEDASPLSPGDERRAEISGEGLIIGTGGISGTISLKESAAVDGEKTLKFTIGGVEIEITKLSVTFRQNAIIGSSIEGVLQIPGLSANSPKTPVNIAASISDDGFSITGVIDDPNGLMVGIGPSGSEILKLWVKEISLGETGGRWFLGGSGAIEIGTIPLIGDFLAQKIDVKKFIIWSNGEIDFEGGSLTLPDAVSLSIGPVDLSVTAVHIGSHRQVHGGQERRYKCIGFDGGVKAGTAGVDARGEGVKFYFTVDDDPMNGKEHHSFLRIETLRVDLTIPGDATPESAAVLLKGFLSMKSLPEGSTAPGADEYVGQVSVVLPKLSIAGSAAMRLVPSTGAFLVDMGLELSTPILLGATGLGIYGFRGMIGNDYVAAKGDNESWWDYYSKPTRGINVEKLANRNGFTAGAGISLATAGDSGRVFSSKLFFLLSLPGLFLLEGQAAILSRRLGLDTNEDPPFSAAIFITDEGVDANFEIDYKLPDGSGDIVEVDARIQLAFFYGKASAWFINIGRDQPESERVQALVLRLAKMYYYLMISSSGIRAGAGAGFKLEKDFAIARIGIGASIDLGARLSFKPMQIGGFIKLWGYAEFKICGFGIRLEISARLDAEAPKPFIITGSFRVSVGLPWPIPDINVSLSLTWRFTNGDLDLSEATMIVPMGTYNSLDDYRADARHPAKALHMVTGEPFLLNAVNDPDAVGTNKLPNPTEVGGDKPKDPVWIGAFDEFTIPVDSFIDIEFTKGVTYLVGNEQSEGRRPIAPITTQHTWTEFIPPQKGHSPQVKHEYLVESVEILFWNSRKSRWDDYQQADLNTPLLDVVMEEKPAVPSEARSIIASHARLGFWQLTQAGSVTKLRILGRTPLEHAADVRNTDLGYPAASLLCPPERLAKTCQDWTARTPGQIVNGNQLLSDRKLRYTITNQNGVISDFPNVFRFGRSLMLKAKNRIEILFSQPTTEVRLKLSTLADNAVISYYLGYPYTPSQEPEDPGSGSSSATDSWDAEPEATSSVGEPLTIWAKLRLAPRIHRWFCLETTAPDIDSGAARSVKDLLEKFALNNYFLRQMTNLPPAAEVEEPITSSAQFCIRLQEVLQTLMVALTGKDEIHPIFQENVEHFFTEIRGYADEYLLHGERDAEPDAEANGFLEKWLGLVTCLGELYDTWGTLPASVRGELRYMVEPEIESAYRYAMWLAGEGAGRLDLDLNPLTWAWDARRRLLSLAGFIGVLGLDFTKILNDDAETLLEPHFLRLQQAYLHVARALKYLDAPACGTPDCDRTKELLGFMRTLCVVNPGPNASPAVAMIQALVDGFEPVILEIEENYGWTDWSASGFCGTLRRALTVAVVAYISYDELPFTLRHRLDDFHAGLSALVRRYRDDIVNATLPTLEGTTLAADEFVADWSDILGCLCRLCTDSSALTSGERNAVFSYLAGSVDPELDAVNTAISFVQYNDLLAQPNVRMPIFGESVPIDVCEQVTTLIDFFAAFFTQCDEQARLLLDSYYYPTFKSQYDGLISWMAGYKHCGAQSTTCSEWTGTLECLRFLRSRWNELPFPVQERIEEDAAPLVDDLFELVFPALPAPPAYVDALLWKVDQVLTEFRETCLIAVDPSSSFATAVAALEDEMDTIRALPEYEGIAACNTDTCRRREQLVGFYESMCMQNGGPLPVPTTALIDLVEDSSDMLGEITAALGLQTISTLGAQFDFCNIFGNVIRAMVIAYGAADSLPITLLAKMNAFCDAVQDEIQFFRVIQVGTCGDTQHRWLEMLFCLCRICRYRGVYPAVDAELVSRMSEQLRLMCIRTSIIADKLELEYLPHRLLSGRCDKLRRMRNYIAVQSLDYTKIQPLQSYVFLNHLDFQAAYENSALDVVREKVCFPVPGPYDPLMKRETRSRTDLLKAVYYDDPAKPIDRIVIEPTGCVENPPGTWLQDYWAALRGMLLDTLITSLGGDLAAMQALRDAEIPDSDEWLKYDELMDEIEDAQVKASEFKNELLTQGLPAGSYDPCTTYLHEVCWMPPAVFDYNQGLPPYRFTKEVAQDLEKSISLMNQPIWRPNTIFAIRVRTNEKIMGGNRTHYRIWGFRTAGPAGHFHEQGDPLSPTLHPDYQKSLTAGSEDEYKYRDIKQYIDYERSYPNADGNLVGAKPLYYSDTKLQIFYRYTHVQSMYSGWGWWQADPVEHVAYVHSALELEITDASETRSAEPPVTIVSTWRKDFNPRFPRELKAFRNIINNTSLAGTQCVTVQPVAEVPSRSTAVPLPTLSLRPDNLYTVRFIAAFGELADDPRVTGADPGADPAVYRREVYRYVFRTSRYPDFDAHIASYQLSAERSAFHTIEIDAPAATAARAVILDPAGASDDLKQRYADELERLMEGVLGITGLPPAITTEFHVVREPAFGTVLGILARSPEPFFDPKISAEDLEGAIAVAAFTGGAPPLRLVYSKDRTRIFITNNGASITNAIQTLNIVFTPWEYDGKEYRRAQKFTKNVQGKIELSDIPAVTVTLPIEWS